MGVAGTSAAAERNAPKQTFANYGPNIRIHGTEARIRRLRYWLDEIFRVPQGHDTLASITRTQHLLTIAHSRTAVVSSGRTRAPMTANLTNGRGEGAEIVFNADIPDEGSHYVFDTRRQLIEFTAVQNLYHELVHAMHKMRGTWLYFDSEGQAIQAENRFREELAAMRGTRFNERVGVRGQPRCEPTPSDLLWGRELICER